MSPRLSENTQAILLLTAPLLARAAAPAQELLSGREYGRLARRLRELQRQPADLLASDNADLLRSCATVADPQRLQRLLLRGFQLAQALESWQTRGLWVVSRADPNYPRRLKTLLKEDAPPVLYGCGNSALLDGGGLAVVGSREVDEALIAYTEQVGRLAANAGKIVVSGGARGVDQAAVRGSLTAGGRAIGVLADGLEKAALARDHREPLSSGRLSLISPYDPHSGFNVGHAMQRNKLVYALSDAALVVNSDLAKGGTWAGATEQLERLHLVPIYVRSTGTPARGLAALRELGALPWPNPTDAEGLATALSLGRLRQTVSRSESGLGFMTDMPLIARDSAPDSIKPRGAVPAKPASPATELFAKVKELLARELATPRTEAEVAVVLGVPTSVAKGWLQRLVEEGILQKQGRPAAFVAAERALFSRVYADEVRKSDEGPDDDRHN